MAILETNQMMFTAFEPKLQNRFLMEIDGIPAYLIKKISRPSVEFGAVVLDHINVKRKIKGKANWADISCDLYDPGYSDFYKKDIYIRTLGPVGDVVEEWILKGAYCSNANFGDMSWDSDTPANISMTIVMDYAILNY